MVPSGYVGLDLPHDNSSGGRRSVKPRGVPHGESAGGDPPKLRKELPNLTYWCLAGHGWDWGNGMIITSDYGSFPKIPY